MRASIFLVKSSTSAALLFSYLIFGCSQILYFPYKTEYNNQILDIMYLVGCYSTIIIQFIIMTIFIYILMVLSHNKEAFKLKRNHLFIIALSVIVNLFFYFKMETKLSFTINLMINCLIGLTLIVSFFKEINFSKISKTENFENIKIYCGFKNLLYTPNIKPITNIDTYYLLSINPNIKTWWSIGLFMLSTKNGVYSKGKFVPYSHIDSMNQQFNKKFKAYTNDELLLLKMYSF